MNKKLFLLPVCMMLLASCTTKPVTPPEPAHDGLSEATAWTAAEAVANIDELVSESPDKDHKELTIEKYYVKDVIKEVTEGLGSYGNITFTMGDGSFTAYRVKKNVNGTATNIQKADPEAELQAGDTVCIYGQLLNFKGTHECDQNSLIMSYVFGPNHVKPEGDDPIEGDPVHAGTAADPYTAMDALRVAAKLAQGATTEGVCYISAKVSKIHGESKTYNADYGNKTFYVSDNGQEKNEFLAWRLKWGDANTKMTEEQFNSIAVGATVVFAGKITNYNGTYEIAQGTGFVVSVA